jgi:hypothetical protein
MLSDRHHWTLLILTFLTLAGLSCQVLSGRQRFLDFSGLQNRSQKEQVTLGQFQGVRTEPFEMDTDGNSLPYVWRPYVLPLTAHITSAVEIPFAKEPSMRIDMIVRNVSRNPYWVPVSADQARSAVLPGNKGRRQLLFNIKVEDPNQQRAQTIRSISLDGSTTIASSLVRLDPAEYILLRFDVSISAIASWAAKEPLNVLAVLVEQQIEDDRYFIWDYSQEVVSEPTVFHPAQIISK